MCYHAKFGRSRSNRLGVGRGFPKNLGDTGAPLLYQWGVGDPLETSSYDTSATIRNLVALCQTVRA